MNQIDVSPKVVDFLLSHLDRELKLLDVAIDSAKEVKEVLRAQRGARASRSESPNAETQAGSGEVSTLERSQQMQTHLKNLQHDVAVSAGPIVDSRKELVAMLATISPDDSSLTLKHVAARVAEPARSELLRLRSAVREKLVQFQSISMSNQTVLVYSLDYYSQLLGSSIQTNSYDANGQAKTVGVNFRYNEAG
jgi:hypothetical protein